MKYSNDTIQRHMEMSDSKATSRKSRARRDSPSLWARAEASYLTERNRAWIEEERSAGKRLVSFANEELFTWLAEQDVSLKVVSAFGEDEDVEYERDEATVEAARERAEAKARQAFEEVMTQPMSASERIESSRWKSAQRAEAEAIAIWEQVFGAGESIRERASEYAKDTRQKAWAAARKISARFDALQRVKAYLPSLETFPTKTPNGLEGGEKEAWTAIQRLMGERSTKNIQPVPFPELADHVAGRIVRSATWTAWRKARADALAASKVAWRWARAMELRSHKEISIISVISRHWERVAAERVNDTIRHSGKPWAWFVEDGDPSLHIRATIRSERRSEQSATAK